MTPEEKTLTEAYEKANSMYRIDLRTKAKDSTIQDLYKLIDRAEERGYRDVNDKILASISEIDQTLEKYKETTKY